MGYNLNQSEEKEAKPDWRQAWIKLQPLLGGEKWRLLGAAVAIVINSVASLVGPILIGRAIDQFIPAGDFQGILVYSGILLGIFVVAFVTRYLQTIWMGTVGQNVLFNLRNAIFNKLQQLPLAFFNENKAGDLISRINNDTDKLNQFFSQSLMQFIGNAFVMIGAGIFLVAINPRLGLFALAPAVLLIIITQLISPWVKARNALNLKTVGGMSAEIQESLDNFKVIASFNRRDYFRDKFAEVNRENYQSAIAAGLANNLFNPIYTLAANLGQLVVLVFGLHLISQGDFTVGLLISFISYVNIFYQPLRQIASLWANLQVALAGWDRIAKILEMDDNLPVIKLTDKAAKAKITINQPVMQFSRVSFRYADSKNDVLKDINFELHRGKTYAFVGPTGGGKTTTASLMARLYDPTAGVVQLDGRDIRSYTTAERAERIGFILQEPFLFSGTVRENIVYGNPNCQPSSPEQLEETIKTAGLEKLMARFSDGLDTKMQVGDDSISLGQRQLIAFIRVVLRQPELLILDEATANIDTVTEQLLQEILDRLPSDTTRVIIAHRLNTIAEADEIFFVNAGHLVRAGSMDQAMAMLRQEKRQS
ncbi:MAG: ABC transporter ATP-binding protein [Patescibacteria group bacterium]